MKHRPHPPRNGRAPAKVNPLLARLMQPSSAPAQASAAPASEPDWQAQFRQAVQCFSNNDVPAATALMEPLLAQGFISSDVNNLGAVLAASSHAFDKALALWRQNLQHNPNDFESLSNLGRMLEQTGNLQPASEHLKRALELQPAHANSHLNLGVVYAKLHRYDDAIACYRKVLELEPHNAKAWFNIGKSFDDQQDYAQSSAAYAQAIALDPQQWDAQSNLLFAQHYLDYFDATANRALAESLGHKKASAAPPSRWVPQALDANKRVLRVGLVSADLRTHPVGFFLEGMVTLLAESDVELYAYANTHTFDELSTRIRPAFKQWEHVVLWSDAALSQRIANDGIDILIDLSGHSAGNRLTLFASRSAPVHISWLGYFSTTGVACMDFVLADPHCVPQHEAGFFTERVLHLPHTRYCFTPLRQVPLPAAMPYQRSGGIRFGCYQVLAKINTRVLACWACILDADASASLVVYSRDLQHAPQMKAFRQRLTEAGVDGSRVDLRPGLPYDDYLQSYAKVDVLLDTFPYPGGTTTAEALWMGVPTLALAQPGMLGRQGQGILSAAGLPQWVMQSQDEYIAAGQALARKESPLLVSAQALRAQPQSVQQSSLFDTRQFVQDWRAALRHAWRLRCAEINANVSGASP